MRDLSIYLPVAVFGYLGYLLGFDTEFLIPHPHLELSEVLLTVTYLRLTVYTAVSLIFVAHLMDYAGVSIQGSYDKLILLLGLIVIVGSVYVSLWRIHETKLYARSIIGLVLSIAQLLFAANILFGTLAGIVYGVVSEIAGLWPRR